MNATASHGAYQNHLFSLSGNPSQNGQWSALGQLPQLASLAGAQDPALFGQFNPGSVGGLGVLPPFQTGNTFSQDPLASSARALLGQLQQSQLQGQGGLLQGYGQNQDQNQNPLQQLLGQSGNQNSGQNDIVSRLLQNDIVNRIQQQQAIQQLAQLAGQQSPQPWGQQGFGYQQGFGGQQGFGQQGAGNQLGFSGQQGGLASLLQGVHNQNPLQQLLGQNDILNRIQQQQAIQQLAQLAGQQSLQPWGQHGFGNLQGFGQHGFGNQQGFAGQQGFGNQQGFGGQQGGLASLLQGVHNQNPLQQLLGQNANQNSGQNDIVSRLLQNDIVNRIQQQQAIQQLAQLAGQQSLQPWSQHGFANQQGFGGQHGFGQHGFGNQQGFAGQQGFGNQLGFSGQQGGLASLLQGVHNQNPLQQLLGQNANQNSGQNDIVSRLLQNDIVNRIQQQQAIQQLAQLAGQQSLQPWGQHGFANQQGFGSQHGFGQHGFGNQQGFAGQQGFGNQQGFGQQGFGNQQGFGQQGFGAQQGGVASLLQGFYNQNPLQQLLAQQELAQRIQQQGQQVGQAWGQQGSGAWQQNSGLDATSGIAQGQPLQQLIAQQNAYNELVNRLAQQDTLGRWSQQNPTAQLGGQPSGIGQQQGASLGQLGGLGNFGRVPNGIA